MSDTSKTLLAELVLHLSYDAGVNGSKFTPNPVGYLALASTPDSLWQRVGVSGSGPEHVALAGLTKELVQNAKEIGGRLVGSLALDVTDGSPWKEAVECLGYEPDMIRDVVAPAIKRRMAEAT